MNKKGAQEVMPSKGQSWAAKLRGEAHAKLQVASGPETQLRAVEEGLRIDLRSIKMRRREHPALSR